MYNPTGGDTNVEWIEIYNNGAAAVDLSSWYVTDYDSSWHYHAFTAENSAVIPPSGYALVVHTSQMAFDDFKIKMPSYAGLLFRASFTLGNTVGRIGLSSDHTTITSDTSYTGSSDTDDNDRSLQLISGSFAGAIQTPGAVNNAVGNGSSGGSSGGSSSSGGGSGEVASSVPETKQKVTEISKIKTQIKSKPLSFVNIPLIFEGYTLGYSGEQMQYGKYYWNFGDGDYREVKVSGQEKFSHTYYYPGTYTVSLEYYTNFYGDTADAIAKTTIKVLPEDIIISKVGDEKDFLVELTNNTDSDSDISKWLISSDTREYSLPKNTILDSKETLTISSKITKFTIEDKSSLKLLNPEHEVVYDFAAQNNSIAVIPTRSIAVSRALPPKTSAVVPKYDTEEIVPLGADVSSVVEAAPIGSSHSYLSIILLIALLGLTSSLVYFIRQKKTNIAEGEDFDILDE